MSKQPLLMTGATGLVGSRFVELYRDQYQVANLDLTTGVDITDLVSIRRFVQAHPAPVMIHLAAFTNTTAAQAQAGDQSGICYQVNVQGTRNITTVCQEEGIHLLHISTDFVFDGTKDSPYTEEDPRSPVDWYGSTKAMAEEVVEQGGISFTIARISYPYRRDYDLKPDLVKKLREGLESGSLPPQFTDTTITPTFVDDLARAFAKVVTNRPTGTYHFVGSTCLSPYELARQVAGTFGYDQSLVQPGTLTKYLETHSRPFARHLAISNAKAKEELGLVFATVETGLSALK